MVQNPPPGPEGDLYRELRRTQLVPQGICVANSSGKPLAWALNFENDDEVLKFLDHAKERYARLPDASQPVATERFLRFPSDQRKNVPDSGSKIAVPHAHPAGEICPGEFHFQPGALRARVVGRAFGSDGNPLSDVRTQDNYIEDRFEIAPALQAKFSAAAKIAGDQPFAVPAGIARQLVSSAYLGMLDVNPFSGPNSVGHATTEEINLWARRSDGTAFKIWGNSEVVGEPSLQRKREGRSWTHSVSLGWQGYLDCADGKLSNIALVAKGHEQLHWPEGRKSDTGGNDVAVLMGGKPIDYDGPVRYGVFTP